MNVESLRREMYAKKISAAKLAEIVGISRQSLYRRLSGQTEFYRSEIEKISKALELSVGDMQDIFFPGSVVKDTQGYVRRLL